MSYSIFFFCFRSFSATARSLTHLPQTSLQDMTSLVGRAVYINGKQGRYLGVCRFHGATAFSAGQWCGVELDRAIGKNDVRI